MISLGRAAYQDAPRYASYLGNSTDEKPLKNSKKYPPNNGDTFYEMDTGTTYMYDAEHDKWI